MSDQILSKQAAVSRRSFVQQSLVATGAACWPLAMNASGESAIAPSDQLSAAVIGAGGIACHHAEHNMAPFFKILAVCDVDDHRAESFNQRFCGGQVVKTKDYRELLQRDDIDTVFVCTPDHWHTKVTIDALRSGKDVYCEKPLTLTIEEGKLIRKVLAETNRVMQVGTQQRSDPNFQTAVALARTGRVGAVKRITAAIGGGGVGGPFPTSAVPSELDWNTWQGQAPETDYIPQRCHGNFRWWYEYSGGKMTDWGAHHVDIARWALGDEDTGNISIDPLEVNHPVPFKDGMPTVTDCYNTAATFRVSCQIEGGPEIVICDEAKDLGFDNGLLFECEGGRYFVNRGKLTGKPVEDLATNPLSAESVASLRKGREVMSHMGNFYRACHDRKTTISDVSSHIQALSICHLANISMRLGRRLQWDPKAETIVGDEDAVRWLSRSQRVGFEVI